jgi:hypothetical protein
LLGNEIFSWETSDIYAIIMDKRYGNGMSAGIIPPSPVLSIWKDCVGLSKTGSHNVGSSGVIISESPDLCNGKR